MLTDAVKRSPAKLADQFADWFINGNKGEILTQRAPAEYRYSQKRNDRDPESIYEYVSIAEQLCENESFVEEMASFRQKVSEAKDRGDKIVFAYRPLNTPPYSDDLVARLIHRINTVKHKPKFESFSTLSESAFLVSSKGSTSLHQYSEESLSVRHRIREFEVPAEEFTLSVPIILRPLLPAGRGTPQINFLDSATKAVRIPGVSGDAHGASTFRRILGISKQDVTSLSSLFDSILENTPFVSSSELFHLLSLYYETGGRSVSDQTKRLVDKKFGLSSEIISKFEIFSRYEPKSIGQLPSLFEDVACFEKFQEIGLSAFGILPEMQKLSELLTKNNIVVLVDGTSYHPEFTTGKDSGISDIEATGEKWGSYIRPGRRVIDSLVRNIIEQKVPDFQNWSVISVVDPNESGKKTPPSLFERLFGTPKDTAPDLSQINQLFSKVHTYNGQSIVVINAEAVKDLNQLTTLLTTLDQYKFKVVVRAREAIASFPQVHITPFSDHQVKERIIAEKEAISNELGLAVPITDEIISLVTRQVKTFRGAEGDPLNYALVTLKTAATRAKAFQSPEIVRQDASIALASIFHLPDPDRTRLAIAAIQEFARQAPFEILGQTSAIKAIADSVVAHISGTRDPTRPLTIMIPGPTGVGKTETALQIALAAGLPFMMLEGSRFVEPHSLASLLGSPSGYVGDDEGILYKFVAQNIVGVVFIDEIEKMHPQVFQGLMNFHDRGQLTAGHGASVVRPGYIVIGATNAGADKLTRTMLPSEVREILSRELSAKEGKARPELVARWEVIPMLALERDEFDKVLSKSLNSLADRYGFILANLKLVGVDETAVSLLFEVSKEVCGTVEQAQQIGFRSSTGMKHITLDLYQDMRYVSRAFSILAQDSISRAILDEHKSGRATNRTDPRKVVLLGDSVKNQIYLADAETKIELAPFMPDLSISSEEEIPILK